MLELITLLEVLKMQTIKICCQIPHSILHIDDVKIACGHLTLKLCDFLPGYKVIELFSMFYFFSDNYGKTAHEFTFIFCDNLFRC